MIRCERGSWPGRADLHEDPPTERNRGRRAGRQPSVGGGRQHGPGAGVSAVVYGDCAFGGVMGTPDITTNRWLIRIGPS